jgi:fructosamine-3-kinase
MNGAVQQFILDQLSTTPARFIGVGGGSINDTYRIESPELNFFCKLNSLDKFPGLFEKEKNGLEFLRSAKCIRVPEVVWCGTFEDKQILILEWIEQGLRTEVFWKKFGGGLAALHRSKGHASYHQALSDRDGQTHSSSDRDGQTRERSDGDRQTGWAGNFGFHEDNYMGALPQDNAICDNWVDFFVIKRLTPQIKIAQENGLLGHREVQHFEQLFKQLSSIFPPEQSAALHGDLWSGNYLCDDRSEPVLIDPAVYYGHRSIDLGMTKLFGGFDNSFYEAYDYHFPLPKNFEQQADVCNLYPLLIHLNLFGRGYLNSIVSILKKHA